MLFTAEFEPAQIDTRRRSVRAPVSLDARIGRGGFDRALCKVVNVSLHGAKLQTYSELKVDATIWLTLPLIGPRAAKIIWVNDFEAGCQFLEELSEEQLEQLVDVSPKDDG
ncbi:PilZ domain-containing protein [Sphingomonas sp. GlSt437]|uniref:PilZ domain-containing protein n=1 Tax=Sphingomonas sp. GlSt437 TaxID=3389970 RepID=UPI003A85AAAC